MLFPKPAKPIRGTAAARRYMALVAQLPCIICGTRPVECHHPIHGRFSQSRASDLDVIPLCPGCHLILHRDRLAWAQMYGKDADYVERVRAMVERMEQ